MLLVRVMIFDNRNSLVNTLRAKLSSHDIEKFHKRNIYLDSKHATARDMDFVIH